MMPHLLLILNVAATWYMVGLIWLIQCVHYAMFDRVGEAGFIRYATDHSRLITPIVGVPMLIEIATAVALLAAGPSLGSRWLLWVGLALVIAIWASTVLLQIPCHEQLSRGYDDAIYQRLVSTNWIRTIAWTLRGLVMGCYLWQTLQR